MEQKEKSWEIEFDDLFEPIDGSLFQNYPATIMIMKKFIGSVLASYEAKVKEKIKQKLELYPDTRSYTKQEIITELLAQSSQEE